MRILRAKGGHLGHLVPEGKNTALCGFRPSSPNTHLMKQRHGWLQPSLPGVLQECKRCKQKDK